VAWADRFSIGPSGQFVSCRTSSFIGPLVWLSVRRAGTAAVSFEGEPELLGHAR
jgi:hypothetical protein